MAINPVSEPVSSSPEQAIAKPVEQRPFRQKVTEGARRLAERVRGFIGGHPPKPDEALQIIASDSLQEETEQDITYQGPKNSKQEGKQKPEESTGEQENEIKISHIDLVTHGQKFEHLFGMYEQIPTRELGKAMQLRSKEENNYFGIGVNAYSPVGAGEAFERGEERTSFMKGGIYGGEVVWVAPVGEILAKKGYVETIHQNPQNPQDGGLVGNGEFGHFSELGYRLFQINLTQGRQKELEDLNYSLDQGEVNSVKIALKSFTQARQAEQGNEVFRSNREYLEYTEKISRSIQALGVDELKAYMEEERRKLVGEEEQLKASLKDVEDSSGIDLMNSLFICFIPEDKVAEVNERIEHLPISEDQKNFLHDQIKPYKDLALLNEEITRMQDNPANFAGLIKTQSPRDINVVLLKDQERVKPANFKRVMPRIYEYAAN